jgi:3-phenylpropionate/cinnamic acid dioxygenase small subunit
MAADDRNMSLLRVAELNAAYAATIDADRLEAWPDFFVESCLYKITSADNHKRGYTAGIVYADSRAMLHDRVTARVTALRTANIYERHSYRHIVGLPVIGEAGNDGLAAETPFLVARIMRDGRTDLFATGVYVDRIHDEAGRLRFAERLVVCHSSRFDTLLVIPL